MNHLTYQGAVEEYFDLERSIYEGKITIAQQLDIVGGEVVARMGAKTLLPVESGASGEDGPSKGRP